jgi:simple sugar transport system ATP-binding protein
MRAKGCGIIVIGEDLEELLMLSDRIAVMYEGRIAGTLSGAEATVARLGLMMTGAEGHA